jgi:aerobic C4-dicarboxylate transport protein
MSEGRALTNCIGNSVATMVVSRWQGELDEERFHAVLEDPALADPAVAPAAIEPERAAPADATPRTTREPVPALT